MKSKYAIILGILLLALVSYFVIASVTTATRTPANFYTSANTSVDFRLNISSDNLDLSVNMTTYLFITENINESNFKLNQTKTNCINNTFCNMTVDGFTKGYYKWYFKVEDLSGNVSSSEFWFEIQTSDNSSMFVWQNDTGTHVMTLDKNYGNLLVVGNVTSPRFNGTFSTGTIIITVDIDDEHIEGDLNTYVDIAGDTMTGNLTVQQNIKLNTTTFVNSTAGICAASYAGTIYYDSVTSKHYGCNTTGWQALY